MNQNLFQVFEAIQKLCVKEKAKIKVIIHRKCWPNDFVSVFFSVNPFMDLTKLNESMSLVCEYIPSFWSYTKTLCERTDWKNKLMSLLTEKFNQILFGICICQLIILCSSQTYMIN